MPFTRNQVAGQPSPGSSAFQRIPRPGAVSAQQQSTVYTGFYGSLPMPAPQFKGSQDAIKDTNIEPSVRTTQANASVVSRNNRRHGIHPTAGRQLRNDWTPQYNKPVYSSEWQKWLIGPQVNFTINTGWYIAYPAATVMNGGRRNLGLSTRVDQLPTRTTGGPGPASMLAAPRFQSVQQIPRYSTMPTMYPTQSQQG